MLSLNKSYKNRKVSLTIHCKYKYFDSAVQGAEDRLNLSNKLTLLPTCGFIAHDQLVEHRTGIRVGHGFESR